MFVLVCRRSCSGPECSGSEACQVDYGRDLAQSGRAVQTLWVHGNLEPGQNLAVTALKLSCSIDHACVNTAECYHLLMVQPEIFSRMKTNGVCHMVARKTSLEYVWIGNGMKYSLS